MATKATTSSASATLSKAKAMLSQTQAQGSKAFAGSSYDNSSSPGTSAPSTPQGGAVNAQGQLVGAGGKILGMANSADRYGNQARPAEVPTNLMEEAGAVQATATQPQPMGGELPYEQALANLQKGGLQGAELEGATKSLKDSYQRRLQTLKQTQPNVPTSPGMAMTAVQATATAPQQPDIMASVVDTEPSFSKSILESYDEIFSPENQRKSLVEEYQNMTKSLGIDQINAELIDAKRIIEGTEDDIRAEVTATGGFATDSQVLALANARNKSLIKNYNALLETRDNAMTQLGTMMQLTVQDRKMAEAEFDRKLNFAFKVEEFKERARDNARSNFNNIVAKVGYKGLFASTNGNLYEQQLIEKTLGLGSGGLAQLALQVDEGEELDMEIKREQLAKLRNDNKPVSTQISPYQSERAFRTVQSVDELAILARQNQGIFGKSAAVPLPGFLRSDAYRDFRTQLDTLKANIAFGELQAMREASKTGGALGSVANQELQLLESTLGGLDMTQSAASFQTQLAKVKQSINRWNQAQGNSLESPVIVAPNGEEVIIID